jgi:hypothetical protein
MKQFGRITTYAVGALWFIMAIGVIFGWEPPSLYVIVAFIASGAGVVLHQMKEDEEEKQRERNP